MSYMFAAKCRIRRIEFGRDEICESRLKRLLVVTHVNYPKSTISVSDYGPDVSLETLSGQARLSSVGEIIDFDQSLQRFLLLLQPPTNSRTRGLFVPACGEAKVRWSARRPSLEASFLAPLSADFALTDEPALWVIDGQYFPWDRELLDPEMTRDFSA